jgi:hypothetical protein
MRTTIEMAREVDPVTKLLLDKKLPQGMDHDVFMWFLERFEALVRADEREACAKVCEDMAKGYEERNALPEQTRDINPEVARIASMTCAFVGDAIRTRGNT